MPIAIPGVLPDKALIGMVHTGPTPGAPAWAGESIDQLVERAVVDAVALKNAGFDAVIVENMHDRPYAHGDAIGPEVATFMTRVTRAVIEAVALPTGVQVLSGGNRAALAVALASGALFVRCENYVFAHVADEGLLPEAEAATLLRYRKQIGAADIRVFADVKKKHASHALTQDLSVADVAEAAEFFLADGVVVTGSTTATPASIDDVRAVGDATRLPVLVGSGVRPDNVVAMLAAADALIVGSAVKVAGRWSNPVDQTRARALVEAARA